MTPDRFNALLEFFGVLFALHNCQVLIADKGQVSGVSIAAIAFFTVWGFWNLHYYRYLGQTESRLASTGLVLANGLWLALYFAYNGTPLA